MYKNFNPAKSDLVEIVVLVYWKELKDADSTS